MSAGEALGLVWLLLLTAASFAALFYVVPYSGLSVYRHKLWRLRDAIHRDIRTGVIPPGQVADELLGGVEKTIRFAKEMSFANVLIFGVLRKDPANDERFEETQARIQALPERCRELVLKHQHDYAFITLRHSIFFTPSGWFAAIVLVPLLPIVFLVAYIGGRRSGDEEQQGRDQHTHFVFEDSQAWRVQSRLPVRRGTGDQRELELLVT